MLAGAESMSLAARFAVRRFVPIVLLALLGACGGGQEPPASTSQTGINLFVNPAQGLLVEPNMPLRKLLEHYTEQMDWSLLVPDGARTTLDTRDCDLPVRLEVPSANVHSFVELLVREKGLLLRFEHASAPVVLQV